MIPLDDGGFALQGREFITAIREVRTPEVSFDACLLPTMRLLDRLEQVMSALRD